MTIPRRGGLLVVLALAISAASAQSASAVIHPDSTKITASSADGSFTYGVSTLACNTWTFQGSTGVSTSSTSGTLTITNSPAGCTSNVGVTCFFTAGGLTVTITTSTATGGTGTLTTAAAITYNCGTGFCVITIPAQGPKSSVTYTNATGNLNLNLTTIAATRAGTGGALCGPASGNMTVKGTFAVTPKIQIV